MLPGTRRARRPATALRSARGQRRVLAPDTQTRITRPHGVQSDHAVILTRAADESTARPRRAHPDRPQRRRLSDRTGEAEPSGRAIPPSYPRFTDDEPGPARVGRDGRAE